LPQGLYFNKFEIPGPNNLFAPRMIHAKNQCIQPVHELKIIKGFAKPKIKICPLRAWSFFTPGTLFEQT